MHALVLAAALVAPGSAEDPKAFVESCRAAVTTQETGAFEGVDAGLVCMGYLAGFGAGLNIGAESEFKVGKASICFRDENQVSVLGIARKVVLVADKGALDDPEQTAASISLIAFALASPCE